MAHLQVHRISDLPLVRSIPNHTSCLDVNALGDRKLFTYISLLTPLRCTASLPLTAKSVLFAPKSLKFAFTLSTVTENQHLKRKYKSSHLIKKKRSVIFAYKFIFSLFQTMVSINLIQNIFKHFIQVVLQIQ